MVRLPERTRYAQPPPPARRSSGTSRLRARHRGGVTRVPFGFSFRCRAPPLSTSDAPTTSPPRITRAQTSATVDVPVSDTAEAERTGAARFVPPTCRPAVLVSLATLALAAVVATSVGAASIAPGLALRREDGSVREPGHSTRGGGGHVEDRSERAPRVEAEAEAEADAGGVGEASRARRSRLDRESREGSARADANGVASRAVVIDS